MSDLYVVVKPQRDKRLGRQVVHDERSRLFVARGSDVIDTNLWRTVTIATYDPRPNPNQPIGCCTGVDICVRFNSRGLRKTGRILKMDDAIKFYSWASANDPWPEQYPPTDTGSSGLAAAKAAKFYKVGGIYRFNFRGADGVVNILCTQDRPVGCGSWWKSGMFEPFVRNGRLWIEPTGQDEGGHQYTARGYVEPLDAIIIRCWWGPYFRDVLIKREHLNDLLMDDGDSIVQDPFEDYVLAA